MSMRIRPMAVRFGQQSNQAGGWDVIREKKAALVQYLQDQGFGYAVGLTTVDGRKALALRLPDSEVSDAICRSLQSPTVPEKFEFEGIPVDVRFFKEL